MTIRAVDLFAGPGGWDEGALPLGIRPLGVEWDAAACATRAAAGHETLQADVSELDPADFAPCELLIGSPPCPTFSSAGDRAGALLVGSITRCIDDLAAGLDRRSEHRQEALEALLPTAKTEARALRDATMSLLVVEPLRWALELRPRLIALEQVPPVLAIWEHVARVLREIGYSAWCGVLSSEQFGVPQTRARAILIARLDGRVTPPAPTHRRFVPMPKLPAGQDSLFEMRRERIVAPGDERLLPWVSMADALGWGMTARPVVTIGGGSRPPDSAGGPPTLGRGSGAQDAIKRERDAGRWRVGFPRLNDLDDGGDYRERDLRDADEPAQALTEKARSWRIEGIEGIDAEERPAQTLCGHHTPRWAYRGGSQDRATERGLDEPAPTVAFGHDASEARFVQRERSGDRAAEGFDPTETPAQTLTGKTRSWTVKTGQVSDLGGGETGEYERTVDAPAPTVDTRLDRWVVSSDEERPEWTAERPSPTLLTTQRSDVGGLVGRQLAPGEGRHVGGKDWVDGRPATTLTGDPRVARPGHKKDRDYPDAPRRQEDAVRITIQEASILQSFRPDYPWTGSRTKQFEQCGNAVPPLLARAVLEALIA